MTVKVIGAGFGRTGTLSLKIALEKLGFNKCHHMQEVFASPAQIKHWVNIAEEDGTPDWDAVFDGFQATSDFPSCTFYQELAEHFPEAKVVLTHRDADSWYRSVSETIYDMWQHMPSWLLLFPRFRRTYEAFDKIIWQKAFDGRTNEPEFAKAAFLAHNAAVQANIPAERLLVFQVKEGWGPLCRFLDVTIPDEPFPHVNDTAQMKRRVKGVKLLGWLPYGLLLLIAIWLLA